MTGPVVACFGFFLRLSNHTYLLVSRIEYLNTNLVKATAFDYSLVVFLDPRQAPLRLPKMTPFPSHHTMPAFSLISHTSAGSMGIYSILSIRYVLVVVLGTLVL